MAVHIEKLDIESFRGIRGLSLEKLNLVNIIAGDNNSGKTSVLEALMFLRDPMRFINILRVMRVRDMVGFRFNSASFYDDFINLFPRNQSPMEILVSGICKGEQVKVCLRGEQKTVLLASEELFQNYSAAARKERIRQYSNGMETISFVGNLIYNFAKRENIEPIMFHPHSKTTGREVGKHLHLNIVYLSPVEHMRGNLFGNVVGDDKYKEICINVLRLFDPQISDLLYLRNEMTGQTVEHIKHETLGNMPISTYGDGIKKVLSLSNGIAQAANGVLMIDELETAIHAKYYDDIFRFMIKACKQFQVQLFITTHSMEAIDKLLATQEYDKQKDADDIAVITFKKESNGAQTLSRTLPGRRAHSNREEFGFEVRL